MKNHPSNSEPAMLGATIDQILTQLKSGNTGNGSTSEPSGRVRLRLQTEPRRRWLASVARTLQGIEAEILGPLRQVVAGESAWPLFLHGPAGCGKTCAGLALCDHANGWYWTVPQLCAEVIESQQGRLRNVEGSPIWPPVFWSHVARRALVVLDELGCRDKVSLHHYECVKELMDCRAGKPLVCLSNLGPDALDRIYDRRIASRLCGGTVVALHGRDRRIEP